MHSLLTMHPLTTTTIVVYRCLLGSVFLTPEFLQSFADDVKEGEVPTPIHSHKESNIGEQCQPATDPCSGVIPNSYCNFTTNTCRCLETYPIAIEGVACVDGKELFATCVYDQQCQFEDHHSHCLALSETSGGGGRCACKSGFHAEKAHEIPIRHECISNSGGSLAGTGVPTVVGLGAGLSILLLLLFFMFKLLSRSGRPRARGYADANAPPTIVLEGADDEDCLDIEKQIYTPALRSSTNSNNSVLLLHSRSPSRESSGRRGSGNNNSNHDGGGSDGGSINNPPPKASTRSSSEPFATGFQLAKFMEEGSDFQQQITIVPNPRAKRRGSMANHAFPELHSKSSKRPKEPDNLLILTRTKTDRNGRRHSVAVPLIPPPDGEKFEGGYHVERNPITGGARLVPPPSNNEVSAASRARPGCDRKTLDVSCRSSSTQQHRPRSGGNERTRSMAVRASSASLKTKTSTDQKHLLLPVPGASDARRHSYQSGGGKLAKDMERLRVTGSNSPRGLSPQRKSTKRRSSSTRRSSKSGFLHFLDLAIAN